MIYVYVDLLHKSEAALRLLPYAIYVGFQKKKYYILIFFLVCLFIVVSYLRADAVASMLLTAKYALDDGSLVYLQFGKATIIAHRQLDDKGDPYHTYGFRMWQ